MADSEVNYLKDPRAKGLRPSKIYWSVGKVDRIYGKRRKMAIVHSEASFPRSSIFEDNQYHLYMSMHVTLQIHVNKPWHFVCFYTLSLYPYEIRMAFQY